MRIRDLSSFKVALLTLALVIVTTGVNSYFAFQVGSFGAGAIALTVMSTPYGFLLISAFATRSSRVGWGIGFAAFITGMLGFLAYNKISLVVDRAQFHGLSFIFVPIVQSAFTLTISAIAEVVERFHANRKFA